MGMFDQEVNISGVRRDGRRVSVSLPSCVMRGGWDAPMSDDGTGTDRESVTFVVKRADWTEVEPPQIGDSVIDENGIRFAVTRVEPFYTREWVLDARGVK